MTHHFAKPTLARSSIAMVTSPHHLASEAGRAVLAGGGNAIEAAIAMGAALAVAYPHFCGLGGDAIWIVADKVGRRTSFLGIGQSAQQSGGRDGPVPLRGPQSALTTACAVDSWAKAFDYSRTHWEGARSWSSLLDSAMAMAENGVPLSSSQAFWLDYRKAEWKDWHGFADIFDTSDMQIGQGVFVQPQLTASLREIAEQGPRSFYEGALAKRIAAGLEAAGSPLLESDLAITQAREMALESLDYGGLTLLAPTAPTQGITTLSIMGTLERLGIREIADGSVGFYHLLVEAIKQSFLERDKIGDPDFVGAQLDSLRPDALGAMAGAVNRLRARPWNRTFATGDTVFFGACDARGRSVSVLQSIYFDWGSGVVAGDTGILWQNRGAAFAPRGHPTNGIRPGARPFYTLNPGMALKDGCPHLIYGTQGADGQPQTLATLLVRLIDHGQDPLSALSSPRFLLGRTFSDSRDTLKLECDIDSMVLETLSNMGHEIALLPAHSPLCGQAGAILIGENEILGAHDPRGDGCALGL